MIQKEFAEKVATLVKQDTSVIGLAAGGSWLSNDMDEFSDLDLVLVTKEKVSKSKADMIAYAEKFGELLTAFTGEHVGEPSLLICLYNDPLLHVDIKFVALEEFGKRVETPVILADTDNQLQQIISETDAEFPYPDYQWIEDRFWIWIHYMLLKIGRGEYFEAMDFLGFLRMVVLGPLLHINNGNLPRGVRKVETQLKPDDLAALKSTIGTHDRASLIAAAENTIALYYSLISNLYSKGIKRHHATEKKVLEFLSQIKSK